MGAVDRIGDRLRRADARRERMLVVYLTLGDPLPGSPVEAAVAAVEAGADMVELGLPTPSTRPRGALVRESFERAAGLGEERVWGLLGEIREALPRTPILPLVYPRTVDDLGWDRLVRCSREAGVDGLVLAGPRGPEEVERVAAADLSAVPLIGPSAADAGRLEAAAGHMTYRGLAARTGERLDLAEARRAVAALAATAGKPFLAGFGIRDEHEIRALAPHAAGLVVGSRLLELLGAAEPRDRLDTLRANVRRWKDATRLRERKREDGCGST